MVIPMNIENECYDCGSYNTQQTDTELECNNCGGSYLLMTSNKKTLNLNKTTEKE